MAEVKRKSYLSETYWGKPIIGFGDPRARLVIIGLAPAAHGANRTGRIFTGDRSGDWLYRALHKVGFANQPTATSAKDGLKLKDVYITCTVKCAPPDNKPTPEETELCSRFLIEELKIFENAPVILVLGKIAYDQIWKLLGKDWHQGGKKPKFSHGGKVSFNGKTVLMSYHPSQQNTFTGRLTEKMFDEIFTEAKSQITYGIVTKK